MSFSHPYLLLSLWAVVLLLLAVYRGSSRRKQILSLFAAGDGLTRLTRDASPGRRLTGALLLVLAAVMVLMALAGPRYGFRWEKIERRGVDIIVALDCSRSMLAEDIKPTRLTRAKYEIIDLLGMLAGDRIGLVAFAGSAFPQCPLTMDYSAFHLFLESLTPDMLPVGGTNLGDAVKTAVSCFNTEDASDKAIVLITDGEQTIGSDPIEAARVAAEKKIKIFCIGVGNDQGAPVPENSGGFTKNRAGKIVLTRLDEKTLQQMAAVTGGQYVRSVAGDMDLEMIYKDKIRKTMEQTTLESGKKKIWEDRFQWFLALALLFISVEMLIPRGKVLSTLLVLLAFGIGASDARAGNVYNDVQKGRTAYDAGAYEKALKHFIDAQLAEPDNGRLYYNIGNAYYKAEQFEEAAGNYKKALELITDDEQSGQPLQKDAWFNLGNAYFRQHDFQKAIEAYRKALDIDKTDKEAEENLALAEKALEMQKKQQQQKNQDQKDQAQQKDQQQNDQQQKPQSGDEQQKKENPRASEKENNDQSKDQQKQSAAAQKKQPDEGNKDAAGNRGEDRQQPSAGQDDRHKGQERTLSRLPDQGEKRLDRLQDVPGSAILMPDYHKREVEQDW